MTSEEIEVARLALTKWQLVVTTLAIFLGPLCGVLFTIWFQGRKERRESKNKLFLVLMAHRKSMPPTFELVNGLNVIDAVFSAHPHVVQLWHEYYDILCIDPINGHLAEAKYLDLLSAMARVLGYDDLSQTAIARYYSPRAHGNQLQMNIELQTELLRVLRGSNNVQFLPRDEKAP